MTEIEQFLKDPSDIDKGIQLYNQFGRYPNLKRVFAKQRQKMLPKLLYELNKIKHLGKQVGQSKTQKVATKPIIEIPKDNVERLTKEEKKIQITVKKGEKVIVNANSPLKELNSQRANLYKRADFLFLTKLGEENTEEVAYEAALELNDIYTKKLPPINKKIDQLLNGELEETPPQKVALQKRKPTKPTDKYDVEGTTDRAELVQMLNNVKSNISRNKSNPKGLKKWEAIQKQINDKLNL